MSATPGAPPPDETRPLAGTGDSPAGTVPAPPGRLLGPWRLLRPLGQGGMGVVWLGERADGAFDRQVAVKVLRTGLDDGAMRERFLLERRTLGALEHPGIARLIDAGRSEDGAPYFVMDRVDGVPLDEWCRAHAPGLEDRVGLLLQVCDAVQYAHSRLVVHRDLKPSNILVESDGTVRLLDFGIAKLLPAGPEGHDPGLTSASERLLTPQFAAPEQLLGQPVGTAADVYSLGMLAYLLFADALPYSLAGLGPAEMQHLVCERIAPAPSERCRDPRRARALRGELDQVVLMALRKEPERRYPGVSAFAADLRAWRDGLPVAARPDTAGYRLRKFARRNRLVLAGAALVFASLAAGLAASLWQAREAGRARAVAEQRYADMRGLATSLMFDVDAAIATLPGATRARRLVVSRALEHLDRLATEGGGDPTLAADLAAGYAKIADIQGNPYEANLGDVAAALDSAGRALEIRRRLAGLAPHDPARQVELARSHLQVGVLERRRSGDSPGAREAYDRALAVLGPLLDGPGATGEAGRVAADAWNLVGDSEMAASRWTAAREAHARARALAEQALAGSPGEPAAWRRVLAVSQLREANMRWWEGAPGEEVIAAMQAAIEGFESLLAEEPGNARLARQVAVAHATLAGVLAYERNVGEARPSLQRALAIGEGLLAADPHDAQIRRDMAIWLMLAADQFEAATYWDEAEGSSQRALVLADALVAADPASLEFWAEARGMHCRHASLRVSGRAAGARGPAFTAAAVCEAALACEALMARPDVPAPDIDASRLAAVRDAASRCAD